MRANSYNLERLFYPRVVAVVGDKKDNGYIFLKALKSFPGPVYSVQIDPKEIPNIEALGYKNYPSLSDIPDPVDLVIIAVPRAIAPKILADCIKKGVGGISLFTSGFAETGTEEGEKLQDILQKMALEAHLPLVGPNCMGIYHPRAGLRFTADQPTEGGQVAVIAQSGTHLSYFSTMAPLYGVSVSLSVSYGNAIVLDSPDYLDYFVQDSETRAIAMYIEGVKEGRRFVDSLRAAAQRKPIVIWKGGITEAGTRATAAHTAALAESPLMWGSLIRQCGAIQVYSLEEMIDVLQFLLHMKPLTGSRLGLVSLSGGQSVAITDAFAAQGLAVPRLNPRSYAELAQFFTLIGGSYRNPFDINAATLSVDNLKRVLHILDQDENIDGIAIELSTLFLSRRWEHDPQFMDNLAQALVDFKNHSHKGLLSVIIAGAREAMAMEARERLVNAEVPAFPSFARAALALRRTIDYHRRRTGLPPIGT